MIKTRFAPSPTGNLHVGSVRTALFSYLFAKAQGGEFILRIEDTDASRSTQAHTAAILQAMNWLGLNFDEGPIYQTQRQARYEEVAEQLLSSGKAYRCTCSKERLEKLREAQIENKEKPRYDGHCRHQAITNTDEPFVVRLKSPETGFVSFDDLVYGSIRVSNNELDDLILMRSDNIPTYNFAVVVDDADMQITHVIRGDDHINNTPRQIHIYEALDWDIPAFAHLPMILGEDGKRLSKRHGAVNVLEFQEEGYLPEALLNYLVRLGWSHQDQEIFSMADMINLFNLAQVSRSAACFDYDKLTWLNQHYLKSLLPEYLVPTFVWQLKKQLVNYDTTRPLAPVIQALVDRSKTMKDMALKSKCFLQENIEYSKADVDKHFHSGLIEPFTQLLTRLSSLMHWQKAPLHQAIVDVCEACSLGMGKVAQPLRVAVTGSAQSPSIDETLMLIGKEWTLARLKHAIEMIG